MKRKVLTGTRLFAGSLLIAMMAALVGCGGPDIKVGFLLDSYVQDRWKKDEEKFMEKIEELGGEVVSAVANSDAQTQLAQAKKLIAEGVKVLVVVPVDAAAAAAIVEEAHKSDVPVVAYDRMIASDALDYYISFDNEKVGEIQASALINLRPEGNYVLIAGAESDNNSKMFKRGNKEVLDSYIDRGQINLLLETHVQDWTSEDAYQVMRGLFDTTSVSIDAVIAGNDALAYGVLRALEEEGLLQQVLVSGQDADLEACRQIVKGNMTATIYKPIQAIAYTAAITAAKLSLGAEVSNATHRVNNGFKEVPSILLEPSQLDKSNVVQTVVGDEYHSEGDIFDTIPQ